MLFLTVRLNRLNLSRKLIILIASSVGLLLLSCVLIRCLLFIPMIMIFIFSVVSILKPCMAILSLILCVVFLIFLIFLRFHVLLLVRTLPEIRTRFNFPLGCRFFLVFPLAASDAAAFTRRRFSFPLVCLRGMGGNRAV